MVSCATVPRARFAAEELPGSTPPRRSAAGDWVRAAEIYARCGAVTDEAFARLQAGGDANLRAALDFYRSVKASRYVRQAEAGLAAIA